MVLQTGGLMKWRIFGSISCFVAAVISVAACHSSSSSNNETSGGLSGACQRVADANSAFAQKCGEQLTAFGASDRNTHDIERSAALCVATYSLPGIPDQTSALNACASALGTAACNTEGEIAECNIAPVGSLSDGTTCVENDQCSGGACSFTTSDAGSTADASPVTCGTCVTALPPGQPCNGAQICVSGICAGDSPDAALCEALPTQNAAVGAACGNIVGCAPPAYCAYDSTGNSGTCTAAAKVGEACPASGSQTIQCEPELTCFNGKCTAAALLGEDCSDKTCGPGLFCSGQKCLAITYGPPGASCDGAGLKCIRGNCPSSSPFGPPTAACPAILNDGQTCNPAANIPSCDTFAACFSGICGLVPSSSGCP